MEPVSTRLFRDDLRSREPADSDHSFSNWILFIGNLWESQKAFVDFISAFVFSVCVTILTGKHIFSLDHDQLVWLDSITRLNA